MNTEYYSIAKGTVKLFVGGRIPLVNDGGVIEQVISCTSSTFEQALRLQKKAVVVSEDSSRSGRR